MERKLDEILESIHEIKADLRYHIKRTDGVEEQIVLMKKEYDPVSKAYNGLKWSAGAIVGLAAVLTALSKILGYL